MFTEELGIKLENITTEMMGLAKRVTVTKDETTIVVGDETRDAVRDRVALIKKQIELSDSEYDKEKLNERVAKLSGGVALIEVGAASEVELKERKLRIEDALAATKAAVEEGCVAGGGVALLNAVGSVKALLDTTDDVDEATGVKYLLKIGNSSFTVGNEVWQSNELKAKGKTVIVHFDYVTQKSVPIPDDVRKKLEEHLISEEDIGKDI